MQPRRLIAALFCSLFLLAGCSHKPEEKTVAPPATRVTVARANVRNLSVTEETVGQVDSASAPMVAAEVPGRVLHVLVDAGQSVKAGQPLAVLNAQDLNNAQASAGADVARLRALVANQQRLVERDRALVAQNFIARVKVEDDEAQLTALKAQLAAAGAQAQQASQNTAKARVVSPIDGIVNQRLVSNGDYVTAGKPLFQVTATHTLRINLPFPETAANRIHPGEAVTLSTPTAPDQVVSARIQDVKPLVDANSRAVNAIVEIANPGSWQAGASVKAAVAVSQHPQAIVVPTAAIVLRPAGSVVYVVQGERVAQRVVTPGIQQGDQTEILSGLKAGETVVVDGAGFLTDGARISYQEAGQ